MNWRKKNYQTISLKEFLEIVRTRQSKLDGPGVRVLFPVREKYFSPQRSNWL
jgi:hypothetical protein